MIAYAEPAQEWTFYEIDPLVVQLAWDRRFFTYLSDCALEKPVVIQGDARLQLQRAPEGKYQMLVLDAFSSDAIPVHLVTREAIELYFSRMAEGGWLVMHLSNRYLDLEQVMAGLAREMDLVGLSWIDTEVDWLEGKEESQWLVLARNEEDLKQLIRDPNRIPLESRPFVAPWTDSRSSILEIFKW